VNVRSTEREPGAAAGTRNVQLRTARKGAVREALMTAWRNRAPKRVASRATADLVDSNLPRTTS
jgi:hypothetical protein